VTGREDKREHGDEKPMVIADAEAMNKQLQAALGNGEDAWSTMDDVQRVSERQ
jgi:hypothetical protein